MSLNLLVQFPAEIKEDDCRTKCPETYTVEQFKRYLIGSSPSLFGVTADQFYLGSGAQKSLLLPENKQLVAFSAVESQHQLGLTVKLMLIPKTAEQQASDMLDSNEEDMLRLGRKAVTSLKSLETVCRCGLRSQFLVAAKEAAVDVHAIIEMARARSLITISEKISTNLGRVMKSGKEVIKQEQVAGASEFVSALKALGEGLKTFIHAYRESFSQEMARVSSSRLQNSSNNTPYSSPKTQRRDSDREQMRLNNVRVSSAGVQYDNAELSGYLTKQGGAVRSWRRRWCVLKDGFISYFKKEGSDETPLGSIPLEGCLDVVMHHSKTYCFAINTPYRQFLLRADSLAHMERWMKALKRYVITDTQTNNSSSKASKLMGDMGANADSTGLNFKSGVEKEGWLTKSGGNGRNWKKRWCVLKESIIYYFKSEKDSNSGAPLGVIPLQDCRVEELAAESKAKVITFAIHTRHRTFKLQGTGDEEVKEWLECIHDAIKRAQASDHDEKIEQKQAAMQTAATMAISYKPKASKVRATKKFKTVYPQDDEVDSIVHAMLGNTKFKCPDGELQNWKNVMAVYLAKQSKRKRQYLRIIPAETTSNQSN